MANVLVNDKWLEVDTDGNTVADLLSYLADEGHTVEHVNGLSVKAGGILLAHSDVLSNQKTLEVVELPSLGSDDLPSVDESAIDGSSTDLDSTDDVPGPESDR